MNAERTFFADYMDGETARVQRASVTVMQDEYGEDLVLRLPDGGEVTWPLTELRTIPDQAADGTIVLGLAGQDASEHPARIVIEDELFAKALRKTCPNLKRRHKDPNILKRLAMLSTGAIASVALIVFVLVPIMADQLAVMLPAKGEKALGDSTFEQISMSLSANSQFGLASCQAPAGAAALDKMMDRLNPGTDFPYDITLHVLNHSMINAFALPGGHIVLFRGLLQNADSAEEIAGIIGHEMGHVEHRDPTRLALRSAGSVGVLGLLLGDFAGGAAVLFLTEKLIQAQYSRGAEAASDVYAHELLAKVGMPSAPMGDFFLRLMEMSGGDEGLLSHLASHPDLQGRYDAAVAANTVGDEYVPVLNAEEWQALRQICAN